MVATPRINRTVTALLIVVSALLLFVIGQKLMKGDPVGEAVHQPTSNSLGQAGMSKLADDICLAAREQSPEKAKEIFEEKIHGPLHVLAGELAAENRPAAARLLQDKHAVEAAIQRNDAEPLTSSLYALSESTVAGLKTISIDAQPCEPPS